MSTELALLALFMGLATYPFRAIPFLVSGFDRLPDRARLYLRLVGPAVLASLAAVNTMVRVPVDRPAFYVGPEWLAVALCVLVVAMRKSLLVGLLLAAGLMAVLRASGALPL